jgi:hypothetical protein
MLRVPHNRAAAYRPVGLIKFATSSQFATWFHQEEVEKKEGGKKKVTVSTAKKYLVWPGRTSYRSLTFKPGGQEVVDRCLNTWTGMPREPKEGDTTIWNQLLDNLFYGKPSEDRTWAEQWLAYPVQHIGYKLKQALILWGEETGTGKSFLCETMGRVYGKKYFTKFGNEHLNSQFNDIFEFKLFAEGEEIVASALERGPISEKLKTIVTGEDIEINAKSRKIVTRSHHMNAILTSNHPVVIRIEQKDRRYFVNQVLGEKLKPDFVKRMIKWGKSEEGLAALYYRSLHVPMTGFNPDGEARMTFDKADMVAGSSSPLDMWLRLLKAHPKEVLMMDKQQLTHQYWTADELLRLFKRTPDGADSRAMVQTISSAMVAMRFIRPYGGKPVPIGESSKRLWFIPRESGNSPAESPADIGRAYNKEREDKSWKHEGGALTTNKEKDNG